MVVRENGFTILKLSDSFFYKIFHCQIFINQSPTFQNLTESFKLSSF